RPSWAPVERMFSESSLMTGAHLSSTKTNIRAITVPVFISAENFSDLQKVKEDLANWLIHREPRELIFKDEQDRVYYAVVDGALDLDELVRWGDGTITFLCPDPHKYAKEEVSYDIAGGLTTLNNKGTANAKPILELTATKDTTFALIENQFEEYMLLGFPADDETEVVDDRTTIIYENGSTLSDWSNASDSFVDIDRVNKIAGSITTDGAGIRAKIGIAS